MSKNPYDGRTKSGKKFIERILARRKAAAEACATKEKKDKNRKIEAAHKAGLKHGADVKGTVKEAKILKNVPKGLLKILSASEKRGLVKAIDDREFDLESSLWRKVYDYFLNSGEMPYGTAKGRDGDPEMWVIDAIESGRSRTI